MGRTQARPGCPTSALAGAGERRCPASSTCLVHDTGYRFGNRRAPPPPPVDATHPPTLALAPTGKYIGILVLVLALGVINEALVTFRVKLHAAYFPCGTKGGCECSGGANRAGGDCSSTSDTVDHDKGCPASRVRREPGVADAVVRSTGLRAGRTVISALYAVNVTLGYLLMLAAMSYDVGVFVCVIVGLAGGHMIFFRKPAAEMQNLLLTSRDGCQCGEAWRVGCPRARSRVGGLGTMPLRCRRRCRWRWPPPPPPLTPPSSSR